jgi:hypothetical protein
LTCVQGPAIVFEAFELMDHGIFQQLQLLHTSVHEQPMSCVSTTYILLLPYRLADASMPRFDQRPIASPQGGLGHRLFHVGSNLLVR